MRPEISRCSKSPWIIRTITGICLAEPHTLCYTSERGASKAEVLNWSIHWNHLSVQFSSVTQSCPTLCDPMNHSTPGHPVHHQLPELTQTHVHWVNDESNHLNLCCPLLLLPLVFPSIRVFSNESTLCMRWPKYWSFSFNISPSNEHWGLISFRMNWWISLQSKELSRVFSNTTVKKHQFFCAQLSL